VRYATVLRFDSKGRYCESAFAGGKKKGAVRKDCGGLARGDGSRKRLRVRVAKKSEQRECGC
jgi:hypothetical protein